MNIRTSIRAPLRALRQPLATFQQARLYATTDGSTKVPLTGNVSSQPQKPSKLDQHNMSNAQNVAHATKSVNSFAKRDPALYPLSIIVVLALGGAGYFFATKATATDDATRTLQMHGLVNPWDSTDKHETHPSKVAEFKYRHKTRDGHYEDSLPTLSSETINLKNPAPTKIRVA